MNPERKPEYFQNFESSALPKITWQEMIENKVVIAPQNVLVALKEAEQFLVTQPGPNLVIRKILAPEWFGYWNTLLEGKVEDEKTELISSEDKLVSFDRLSNFLGIKYRNEATGMLFVAGAEGHGGHVHAAKYMSGVIPKTIWGFEQSEYMKKKARGAHFLPLELRLSMWFYEPSLTHLTVLPKDNSGKYDNEHYTELFFRSGTDYFFVHEKDPYLEEKLARGKQDIDTVIHQNFPIISTSKAVRKIIDRSSNIIDRERIRQILRIIPDLPIESTSDSVLELTSDIKDDEDYNKLGSEKPFPSFNSDKDSYQKKISLSNLLIGYGGSIFVA